MKFPKYEKTCKQCVHSADEQASGQVLLILTSGLSEHHLFQIANESGEGTDCSFHEIK